MDTTCDTVTTGIESEDQVIRYMDSLDFGWTPAVNPFHQMNLDVDAWGCSHWDEEAPCGISIKTQHKALHTGNVAFELEHCSKRDAWQPSWFVHGKPDYYLFRVGCMLYLMRAGAVKRFINRVGFLRVVELSKELKATQVEIGHPHLNAKSGLDKAKGPALARPAFFFQHG